MKKVTIKDIGGEVVKDNSQYLLKDNAFGNNLILSSTFLRANQKTNGHTHAGQEEVYMFIDGEGEMDIDGNRFPVKGGDVVCICLLYTSPSPRDKRQSRMPSSA